MHELEKMSRALLAAKRLRNLQSAALHHMKFVNLLARDEHGILAHVDTLRSGVSARLS
jgi:hypothetical protein